jgi:hypothetical protein
MVSWARGAFLHEVTQRHRAARMENHFILGMEAKGFFGGRLLVGVIDRLRAPYGSEPAQQGRNIIPLLKRSNFRMQLERKSAMKGSKHVTLPASCS